MIGIKELRRLALDGDLAATQEIIIRLEAAEKERDELRTELNEIRYGVAVAHDTIKALRAKIERINTLEMALRDVAQTLAWMQHGRCRGFSEGPILTTNEALTGFENNVTTQTRY